MYGKILKKSPCRIFSLKNIVVTRDTGNVPTDFPNISEDEFGSTFLWGYLNGA